MLNTIKLFIISCIIFFSSIGIANEEYCSGIKEVSKLIMTYRQEGSTYSQLMQAAIKNDFRNETNLEEVFVKLAFTYPRIFDSEARQMLIDKFSQERYNNCIQALKSK